LAINFSLLFGKKRLREKKILHPEGKNPASEISVEIPGAFR
jgi:hypothetical protein